MGALQSKLMAFMRQEESSGETGLAATGGTNAEDESVAAYKDPAFHDRLRKDWPEDGDQLHSGGWDMTKKLLEEIENEMKKKRDHQTICRTNVPNGGGAKPREKIGYVKG
eukprot:CAMPEP_0171563076 /NCGR_PEP_ID=MMETSP0960-20121227/15414_1 /TAXON_ID=87120 /ORGANISM="Aurantiochytrium limacinum, Strain ATCCMYA-1381" /LENGTH=109 /DNA_ID=CAMNT_0012116073 /DNA_START=67 /DNA_END=396 /DNA_ORIENTATION=-